MSLSSRKGPDSIGLGRHIESRLIAVDGERGTGIDKKRKIGRKNSWTQITVWCLLGGGGCSRAGEEYRGDKW